MYKIITILLILMVACCQYRSIGTSPCPLQYTVGSVVSTKVTIAESKGLIPLMQNQSVQCFNYSLPYEFSTVPKVALAIHDLEADYSSDLYFSIKPLPTESKNMVPLLIRTQWKYTRWRKISFTILVEDRQDFQAGHVTIDTLVLGACDQGKNIHAVSEWQEPKGDAYIQHRVFLNGFQISTEEFLPNQFSPFQIQIVQTMVSKTSLTWLLSVTTITQVHALQVSYLAWQNTSLEVVDGQYKMTDWQNEEITHVPIKNVGRNYARIFGLSGFIILQQGQQFVLGSMWTGDKFVWNFGQAKALVHYLSFDYTFFLGSACAYCPNYPYIYNDRCVNVCPTGYSVTSENICISCGDGFYWDGQQCSKVCQMGRYLNPITNDCECPSGSFWNDFTCLRCVGGRVFNNIKKICECPEGTRWNGFGCATAETCQHGQQWNVFTYMCECPINSYWNGTYCTRTVNCQNGQIPDGNNGCVCPQGTHWNQAWCQPHSCLGGQVWINGSCACEDGYNWNGTLCIKCINLQEWNPTTKKCLCPSGYSWNGNYCQRRITCKSNQIWNETFQACICRDGQFWNGFACMVKPTCSNGKKFNEQLWRCECPQHFNWDGSVCVLCLDGKIWSENEGRCTCREGTQWNGNFCMLVQECQGGMIWNQNTWSCQCGALTVWNGNYCIANPCLGGKIWDNQKRECICLNGRVHINGACLPKSSACAVDKIWDSTLYKCVCVPGLWQNNGRCQTIPECPTQQHYNPLNRRCQCPFGLVWLASEYACADPTCPQDQRWNSIQCVKISCPPNSYYNGTHCIYSAQAVCQVWEVWNGVQCVYEPGTCPTDTQWNGTMCVSVGSVCPLGFYWDGVICRAFPQLCAPPAVWIDNGCRVLDTCPYGTYQRGGQCFPYNPCTNGQSWNTSLINCVCPEGTEWNGERCVGCSGGRVWQPFEGCRCPTAYFFAGLRCERLNQIRCSNVPNALWDGTQCLCHQGFTPVALQCICEGVIIGDRCDRCAHLEHSQWKYGRCWCKKGYTMYQTQCLPNHTGNQTADQCNTGTFYDSQQRRCLACSPGCLSCNNTFTCQQCDIHFNFDVSSQLCSELCGDGRKYVLECDDGNNQGGDGCSVECKIEQGYVCRGGSPSSEDFCFVYSPTNLTFVQVGQVRYPTQIIINVKLDYLPKQLLQSPSCTNSCSGILNVTLVSGDTGATSITSTYISGSSYTFAIEVQFGRSYIGKFTALINLLPSIKQEYYKNVDVQDYEVVVQPKLLSRVEETLI